MNKERIAHSADAVGMLRELFLTGEHSVVIIRLGPSHGRDLHLHKLLLCRCEYFSSMLGGEFKEGKQASVDLEVAASSSADAMADVIEYLYTREISLDGSSVMEILAAADQLQIAKLVKACEDFLMRHLSEANVCTVLRVANELSLDASLQTQAVRFLHRHAAAVLAGKQVTQLPREALLALLDEDHIDVDEEIVYQGVVKWGEAHKGDGTVAEAIKDMLPLIRFSAMDHVFLQQTVRPTGLIDKDELLDATMYRLDQQQDQLRTLGGGGGTSKGKKRSRAMMAEEEGTAGGSGAGSAAAAARPKKRRRRRGRPAAQWRTYAEDCVAASEEGRLATQTADYQWSLTHTGEELTEGRHYWEVEIVDRKGGNLFLGVCRPDADPRAEHWKREDTTAWFMNASGGYLYGNGKQGDDRAGTFNDGDRMGILLDLDDGSLRFFKNGVEHGPGYQTGSVTGPVAMGAQMYCADHRAWGTHAVRLLPDAEWPAGHAP